MERASRDVSREGMLAEVRRIVDSHLGEFGVRVYLFGSFARRRERTASDIDVGILPSAPLPAGLLSHVREDLEESWIPYRVDLVDLSQAGQDLMQSVMLEGIPWNDSNND